MNGEQIRQRLAGIPHVLLAPAPEVDVLQLAEAGPVLCAGPCCTAEHYWHVCFDTNRMIRETFTAAGFPVPAAHLAVHGVPTAA